MKFFPLMALFVFVLFGSVALGQPSGNAQDFFDRGLKRYQSGDLEGAIDLTLRCDGGYRQPEPTRRAHLLVNALRRGERKPTAAESSNNSREGTEGQGSFEF